MKRHVLVLALGLMLLPLTVCFEGVVGIGDAAQVFVWGNIRWITGTPAAGLEIRLLKGDAIRAKAFTNQVGRYTFFDIGGKPSDYRLEVFAGERRLKRVAIPDIPTGRKVPDLVVQ